MLHVLIAVAIALITGFIAIKPKHWGFPLFMAALFGFISGLICANYAKDFLIYVPYITLVGWLIGVHSAWNENKITQDAGGSKKLPF